MVPPEQCPGPATYSARLEDAPFLSQKIELIMAILQLDGFAVVFGVCPDGKR